MAEYLPALSGNHLSLFLQFYALHDRFESLAETMCNDGEVSPKYDSRTVRQIVLFFNRLENNPNMRVRLVVGKDSVCRRCWNEDCCFYNGQERLPDARQIEQDTECLDNYSLRPGDTRTVRQLIGLIA